MDRRSFLRGSLFAAPALAGAALMSARAESELPKVTSDIRHGRTALVVDREGDLHADVAEER